MNNANEIISERDYIISEAREQAVVEAKKEKEGSIAKLLAKIKGLEEKINKVEKYTRENKDADLNEVINDLKDIDNKVWQSYAAILATYNFRKHRRTQNELDELKKFITNEFKSLFEERYNQLH